MMGLTIQREMICSGAMEVHHEPFSIALSESVQRYAKGFVFVSLTNLDRSYITQNRKGKDMANNFTFSTDVKPLADFGRKARGFVFDLNRTISPPYHQLPIN